MKQKHSSKILQFAANFASRESAFILAIIGVLSQAAHTTYITYHLSSLDGAWKLIQAAMMALFFNGALLYFVLKGESGSETQRKRYMKLVYLFAGLEVFMNLYYWSQKFIIESWPDASWDKLIIALPMAFILPITLAMYSYEVRVEDFTDENDENESEPSTNTNLQEDTLEQLKQQLASQLSKQYDEKIAQTIQEMLPLQVSHIDLGINSKIESELSKYHENKFDLIFDSKQNVGETKVLKDVIIKPSSVSSENTDNFETHINEHDAIFSESGITPSEPSSETDEIEESDNVIQEHTETEQDKSEDVSQGSDTDSETNSESKSVQEPEQEPEQEPSSETDSTESTFEPEQTNNPETKLFEYQEK